MNPWKQRTSPDVEREKWVVKMVRDAGFADVAGFEDEGRQLWAKECGQPLEAGKGKEAFSTR